ncbi:MAG: hypothetical protein JZU58_28540 [Curvibacter lanceolatus]|uniref:hypothetical protein n=1 Tax=Curvibacter lanceolatus TaxID=86182 RepID=UPI0023534EFE|nr:hypothetical protein [Curvibacter lanceolatus]MBV5296307.1 hypothetical protein [Curvibacter lanceolatus]
MADIDLPSTQRVSPEFLERSKVLTRELLRVCLQEENSSVVVNALLSALLNVAYAANRLDEMPACVAIFLSEVAHVKANLTSPTPKH